MLLNPVEAKELQEEVPEAVRNTLQSHGIGVKPDHTVFWLEDAPAHPRNWSLGRKLYDTGIITLFVTISAMVGNGGNTVARPAAASLGISPVVSNICFAAVYYYGQAIGGLVIPPYTECFGRKRTNVLASIGMAAMCAISGTGSVAAVVVGRFTSGFLSAMPAVVGSGSIEDMWSIKPRIWAIDVWIKGSIVGIALGPCFGTYISSSSLRWPWTFYIGAVMLALGSVLYLWTKESRPSKVLQWHIEAIQRSSGYDQLVLDNMEAMPSLRTFATRRMLRPVQFFFTDPIVCTVSIMSATVFASVFLQTQGLVVAYQDFGYTERQASLVFTAWIVGLILTIPLRILDWRIVSRRTQRNQTVLPEDKIVGFYIAAPVLAATFWWWSWTVPPYAHDLSPWISIVSLIFIGACVNEFDGVLSGYLTDSYTMYAASANAPLAFLRALLSGSFPIFGYQMFQGLGSNVSGSIVASIASLFVLLAIWFWKYGQRIRENSSHATSYK